MDQIIQANQPTVLSSPMPGKIVKILAREGDTVEKGQGIFIVETMKMLHELRVARNGKMSNITVKEGDAVLPNSHLAYIL
jgi:biotin carboxyl carrier protein